MSTTRLPRLAAALLLAVSPLTGACGERPAEAPADRPGPERPTGGLTFVEPEDPAQPDLYELGHVELGEQLSRTILLRNDDGRPLRIRSIRPSCSCTAPRISYLDASGERVRGDVRSDDHVLTLPPGAVAQLEVGVDTRIAPEFNRHKLVIMRITTDSATNPYTSVQLRMLIQRAFSAAPPVIDLQQVAIHGIARGKTDLVAVGDTGARLVDVLEAPGDVEARLERKSVFGAEVWELTASLHPPLPRGLIERTILLRTTGPGGEGEGRPHEVRLRAIGVDDVQLEPPLLPLQVRGEGPATASAQLISRLAGLRVRIADGLVECAHAGLLELRYEPVGKVDEQGRAALWDVSIVATGDLPAQAFSGEIVLTLDDPQYPTARARFLHRPRPQSP